jgi:hypothetical protein
MQFYINWKVISVSVTCSDTCHYIIIHIFNEGNVVCLNFVLLQGPPHDIPSHFVICLLQVNDDPYASLSFAPYISS